MLSTLNRVGLIALAVVAAGCGSSDRPAAEAAPSCRAYESDLESRFRTLPERLWYVRLPEEKEQDVRDEGDPVVSTTEVRAVRSGAGLEAVVVISVLERPLLLGQRAGFVRGFARTMPSGDATHAPVDLPGGPATRFEAPTRIAYVQVQDDCRVITVAGRLERPVRRVAEAVLR